jgi:hypothetical protein
MGTIQYKIRYDLWQNKDRTLQVVLIVESGDSNLFGFAAYHMVGVTQ